MKDMAYDLKFMCVIRGRWSLMLTQFCRSMTHRVVKGLW
jgi:hypothetical protein